MEIQEKVLKALKESKAAMKSAELAVKTGIDKAEVDKAIKALKKAEKIVSTKACFYTVKQDDLSSVFLKNIKSFH